MPLSANGLCEAEIIAAGTPVALRERTRPPASAPRRARTTSTPSAREPGDERGLEHRARDRACRGRSTTAARRPSTRAAARPRREDELGGELGVGDAADAVGAEAQASRGDPPSDQRLEYCGALRAFLRPYFLLSFSRGVAGEEAGLLQRGPQLGVELDERPGDAEAQGAGLAADAAAVDAWRRRRRPRRSR